MCSTGGTTGEIEKVALVLLRARRKDEVEEELTREARRGLGEHLLERCGSPEGRRQNGDAKQQPQYFHTQQTNELFTRLPFAASAVSVQGLVSLWWGLLSLLLGQVLDIDREASLWWRDRVGVSMPPGSVASG